MRHNIAIDFETAYSQQYSLRKMTTQAYVYNDAFEFIGVGYKLDDEPTKWVTGHNVEPAMKSLPWDQATCIAHNAMFDGLILEGVLGLRPAEYFCTMMASRPFVFPKIGKMGLAQVAEALRLGVKGTEVHDFKGFWLRDFTPEQLDSYGEYCKQDVRLCRGIYDKLNPRFSNQERTSLDLTVKKFTRPVLRLDRRVICNRIMDLEIQRDDNLVEATMLTDERNLMSNNQFAEILNDYGVPPGMKMSPRTGKKTYAFAKDDPFMQDLLVHARPEVKRLAELREYRKYKHPFSRNPPSLNNRPPHSSPCSLHNLR